MEGALTVQAAKAMKVAELKAALEGRGLPTDGLKAVLLARLLKDMDDAHASATAEDTKSPNAESVAASSLPAESSPLKEAVETVKEPAATDAAEELPNEPRETAVDDIDAVQEAAEIEPIAASPEKVRHLDVATGSVAEMTEEERLRELVKMRIKMKKPAASASSQSPAAAKTETPTRYLRIDNFQRPLNPRSLKEWLTEVIGSSFEDANIWLNAIKTHCYVDFPTVEAATDAISRLKGQRWPSTNPKTLEPAYTSVSAKEAPMSAEAAMRPGEWKNPPRAVHSVQETSKESVLGKRKIEVIPGAAASILKNAMADAGVGVPGEATPREAAILQRLEGSTDTGFSTRRHRDTDGGNQPMQLGLDDLFRKTDAKPHLYWLPLSEDEVARKKAAKLKASCSAAITQK